MINPKPSPRHIEKESAMRVSKKFRKCKLTEVRNQTVAGHVNVKITEKNRQGLVFFPSRGADQYIHTLEFDNEEQKKT
jgi:hypothetical protein